MARQGVKRTSAGGRVGAAVAKKCKTIASTIRRAEGVPEPVQKMINDKMLMQVFGTYKEERIPFQKTMAELVGKAMTQAQDNLRAKINEAQANKGAQEAGAAQSLAASEQENALAAAAAQGAAAAKQAVDDSHAARKASAAAVHDLGAEIKNGASDEANAVAKKQKLESLVQDFFTPVKEGTLAKGLSTSAAAAGKFLGKTDLEHEFIVCVVRTFSKASSTWGTFDNIVAQKLEQKLNTIVASEASGIASMAAAQQNRHAQVEPTSQANTAAAERVTAAEQASTAANAAAKAAAASAKVASASHKTHQHEVEKAAHALKEAEAAMADFQKGAVAAFTEVEALEAPPPAPEKPAETPAAQAAPTIDAAMTAAPPVQQRPTPSVLPSPGVLFMQAAQGAARAVGLSPRVTSTPQQPRVTQSPRGGGSHGVGQSPRGGSY